jgi:hypothetical protein
MTEMDQFWTDHQALGAILLVAFLLFIALRGRADITRAKLGGRDKTIDKERDPR